jgi:hypothetical protein
MGLMKCGRMSQKSPKVRKVRKSGRQELPGEGDFKISGETRSPTRKWFYKFRNRHSDFRIISNLSAHSPFGPFIRITTNQIIEIACTIIILPMINCPPDQWSILSTKPSNIPAKLRIKSITGYLKLKNMRIAWLRFLFQPSYYRRHLVEAVAKQGTYQQAAPGFGLGVKIKHNHRHQ